jgi:hypothetical protein
MRSVEDGHHRLVVDRRRHCVVVVASLAALAIAGIALAGRDDGAPVFSGLDSAVTCIPGPIAGQQTVYHLSWMPARDGVTPPRQIVYDVYQTTTSGGEDFSSATYVTRRGVTSFDTPPLPADTTFFFVVRARDRADNEDANKIERQGVNLCV